VDECKPLISGVSSPCIFEYIYLARPDSTLNGGAAPPYTPYTPPIHPLYTPSTPPIHPLYTPYAPPIHRPWAPRPGAHPTQLPSVTTQPSGVTGVVTSTV
jgi:hypothetical protein